METCSLGFPSVEGVVVVCGQRPGGAVESLIGWQSQSLPHLGGVPLGLPGSGCPGPGPSLQPGWPLMPSVPLLQRHPNTLSFRCSLADFQIEKKIGRGQFSEVYKATCLLDRKTVALKKVQVSQLSHGVKAASQEPASVSTHRGLGPVRAPSFSSPSSAIRTQLSGPWEGFRWAPDDESSLQAIREKENEHVLSTTVYRVML